MNIVVLDGYTTTRDDLSWQELEQYGDLRIYPLTARGELLARARDADILLTNKTELTEADLQALPRCQFISILATGYDVVDVKAAAQRQIPVSNVPTYGTPSVAQLTFALLLELAHHVADHSRAVKSGRWSAQPYNTFSDFPLVELKGKTMGFIGFGRIGQAAGRIAAAFGMKILAHDRYQPEIAEMPPFEWVSLDDILRRSDILSLHCPLLPETVGLINKETLACMKPTAFLLNTSRGKLVVEQDLADALNSGRLAGAGLDVLWDEPPVVENPLFRADRCFITPHMAWATRESRSRLIGTTVANVAAFISGTPINVVNPIIS